MDWEAYSFLVRSKFRIKILTSLKHAKTPTQLAEVTDSSLPKISQTLNDLKKQSIVECMNPKQKTGRLYALTDKGLELLEYYTKSMND